MLERDRFGPIARANLSVKVSALTPLKGYAAPEQIADDAKPRLREIFAAAADLGAHIHVDAESIDWREAVHQTVLGLLAEEQFASGPSVGLVVQTYHVDADQLLERIVENPCVHGRVPPITIRLVKGAYWDHESAESEQCGWQSPVFSRKAESDREFERLSRRLLDASDTIRPAIASHNLRSVSHAAVYHQMRGGSTDDIEYQVLRGLGEPIALSLSQSGYRVRVYCPIGDLVAGMAYLVRRLLENTSNDSFLAAQAHGGVLDELLAAP